MAVEDNLKRIEERLTRLEATLAQQAGPTGAGGGFPTPGGAIVDPAPWGGWGGWGAPRWPWPHPIVDPAPWPRPWPWPHPIVDPGPWPSPVVDPAPSPWAGVSRGAFAGASLGRIGTIADPPPIDVSRFSLGQLESTLHSINAEKARLNSLETLINQQMDRLKKQQG